MGEHGGGGHEGEGGGHHEAPLWERLLGWGNAGVHAVEKKGLELMHEVPALEHSAHVLHKYLPYVGTAVGVGQFGYHAHEAANTPDNGSYTNNEHWTHTGEATLGAAGAAASWCPIAAAYLGGGELALDGLGAGMGWVGDKINKNFHTDLDLHFTAGSVVGGIEHVASNVSMKNHPIINSLMMSNPITAPIALAANMGDVVTGAGEAIDTVGHGIGQGWDWTKEKAGQGWDWTKEKAGNAWDWTKNTAQSGWDATKQGASDAWDWTKNTAQSGWNTTKQGASDAWDWTKNTAQSGWDATKQGAGDAWDWTKGKASGAWEGVKDVGSSIADW